MSIMQCYRQRNFWQSGKRAVAVVVTLFTILTFVQPMAAYAYTTTCGGLCSGADGDSDYNAQHNTQPQLYIGEVGTANFDFAGQTGPCPGLVDGFCFRGAVSGENDTAQGALNRRNAGSGLGIAGYYVVYGPEEQFGNSYSALCWGWEQGIEASAHATSTFGSYFNQMGSTFIAMDIEADNNYGWSTSDPGANKEVFDGFWDYLTGENTSCGTNTETEVFQPEVYASPVFWGDLMGSGTYIANTPAWTTEPSCYSTSQPQTMAPPQQYTADGYGPWTKYTNHLENWQFWQSTPCGSPLEDYDTGNNMQYLPLFGTYMN